MDDTGPQLEDDDFNSGGAVNLSRFLGKLFLVVKLGGGDEGCIDFRVLLCLKLLRCVTPLTEDSGVNT